MKKTIVLLLSLALVGGVAYAWWRNEASAPSDEEEIVYCTQDAMLCPNGTYVGRTGPNCEFVCPAE